MSCKSRGFALITVLMFLTVVLALMATYSFVTRAEVASMHASKSSFSGFNAAEAGLNLRADMIKNQFVNYNRPSGSSPLNDKECAVSGHEGSGDFACLEFQLDSKHHTTTYVSESAGNPKQIVIPRGEPFANLTASEYRYTVASVGKNNQENREADLGLIFKTRLIPLFQFLLFFEGDMELVEGGNIVLGGPIHSNKDIYYAQQAAYWIPDPLSYFKGPISSVGGMYRGAKFQSSCFGGSGGWDGGWNYDMLVDDLSAYRRLPVCSGSRFAMTDVQLAPFNGNVVQGVTPLTVPDVKTFQSFSKPDVTKPNTFTYWARSDTRFVLRLDSSGLPNTTNAVTGIEVVDVDGNVMANATAKLNDPAICPGNFSTGGGLGRSVGAKGNWGAPYAADGRLRLFRDYQHFPTMNNFETLIDVDLKNLFNCMHNNHSDFLSTGDIDEDTDGGLVLYFAVDGPNSSLAQNDYAVRFSNGALLQASVGGAPLVKGLTLVTDQKAVLWGDYNANDATWIPSAILSDSQYILSNTWLDSKSNTGQDWWNRFTGTTSLTQQVAILSGTAPSCGGDGVTCEGSFNEFGGGYTGVFRFNETFYDGTSTGTTTYTQQPMVWKGSIVSLHAPYHSSTIVGPFNYFSSPSYVYSFDTRFNDPDQLPPLTPRAVYNKQELFERSYN